MGEGGKGGKKGGEGGEGKNKIGQTEQILTCSGHEAHPSR